MTTPNLDALAKRLPVTVSNGQRREMDVLDGDLFFGDDGERLDPDHIAAALNEWAELRAILELVAGNLLAAQQKRADAPCSADEHIDEAVRAVVQFGPKDGMLGERAKAMRAEMWDSQVMAENAALRAYRERTEKGKALLAEWILAVNTETGWTDAEWLQADRLKLAMDELGLTSEPGQGAT